MSAPTICRRRERRRRRSSPSRWPPPRRCSTRSEGSGEVPEADFPHVVGSISFFVNAGVRLITEVSKMRAFVDLWDEIAEKRYGVKDPALRRFRYGVQVNSLGLTEQQPENNVYRILLSMLAVTLSKKARARAVQLPAWNEALGLPRPWDQQWSLQASADRRLRDRPARLWRHLRRLGRDRPQGRGAQGPGPRRARQDPGQGRGGGGHRLYERGADRVERRAGRGDREGRAGAGRGQRLYRDRGVAALGKRHRGHPHRAGIGRDRAGRGAPGLAAAARRQGGAAGAGRSQIGGGRGPQHHAAFDRSRQSRRHHRRMGPGPARGVRRISRADRHPRQAPDRQSAARRRAPHGRAGLRQARPHADLRGRQAGTRRPFQRRRADRRARHRCRHGGGL